MWANRVISVDLYWNHSVEQQAFGRVLRLGQKKEMHFLSLAITNSIDDRMLEMQFRKMKDIDTALQDTGSVTKSLTMKEVAELFGITISDMEDEPEGDESEAGENVTEEDELKEDMSDKVVSEED